MFKGLGQLGQLGSIMKQAKQMQENLQQTMKKMDDMTFSGSSGGGTVTAKVQGYRPMLTHVNIDSEVYKEDQEVVGDLIVAAVNHALKQHQDMLQTLMKDAAGGLDLGDKLPF